MIFQLARGRKFSGEQKRCKKLKVHFPQMSTVVHVLKTSIFALEALFLGEIFLGTSNFHGATTSR